MQANINKALFSLLGDFKIYDYSFKKGVNKVVTEDVYNVNFFCIPLKNRKCLYELLTINSRVTLNVLFFDI